MNSPAAEALYLDPERDHDMPSAGLDLRLVGGSFQYIAQTSTRDGGIFGWLLELGGAGDFLQAIEVFRRASAILDRLFATS